MLLPYCITPTKPCWPQVSPAVFPMTAPQFHTFGRAFPPPPPPPPSAAAFPPPMLFPAGPGLLHPHFFPAAIRLSTNHHHHHPPPKSPKISPITIVDECPKKKVKIFRPWDDDEKEADADQHLHRQSKVAKRTAADPTPIAAKITADPSPRQKSISTGNSNLKLDDLKEKSTNTNDADQSKSAFEVFATNLGKSPDGHRCIYCGKMYSRKYGLKIHLRTHTGFKPLKCKVCSRPFGDPSNLNKHVRLHADVLQQLVTSTTTTTSITSTRDHREEEDHEEQEEGTRHQVGICLFKCPFCARNLIRKRDLERHLASRHPHEHVIDVERL